MKKIGILVMMAVLMISVSAENVPVQQLVMQYDFDGSDPFGDTSGNAFDATVYGQGVTVGGGYTNKGVFFSKQRLIHL